MAGEINDMIDAALAALLTGAGSGGAGLTGFSSTTTGTNFSTLNASGNPNLKLVPNNTNSAGSLSLYAAGTGSLNIATGSGLTTTVNPGSLNIQGASGAVGSSAGSNVNITAGDGGAAAVNAGTLTFGAGSNTLADGVTGFGGNIKLNLGQGKPGAYGTTMGVLQLSMFNGSTNVPFLIGNTTATTEVPGIKFFATTSDLNGIGKQVISGSRSGATVAVLTALLAALGGTTGYNLITDSTTA
jgi:hypothetical protein